MDSKPTDLPPSYFEATAGDSAMEVRVRNAMADLVTINKSTLKPIARKLESKISAYAKDKNPQHNKYAHDEILTDFRTLIDTVKDFKSKHGTLKDVNVDTVTYTDVSAGSIIYSLARKNVKVFQRAMECVEGSLQSIFISMKEAKVFKDRAREERETEDDLVAECGVDMAKDYKLGWKYAQYLRLIKLTLVG
jgi:hypothetical protein